MIRINLATRKQAVSAEGDKRGGTGLTGFLGGMRHDSRLDGLKDLPLRTPILIAVVTVAGMYFLDSYKEDELAKVNDSVQKLRVEQTRLKGDLAKTKNFDTLKKALEGDELTLRTKVDTIQKLLNGRQAPPKMLMTLATAIPQEVWLRGLKITENEASFSGSALGFNPVADFVKNLNESAYFTDVRLQGTQETRDESGAEVATFELQAKRR